MAIYGQTKELFLSPSQYQIFLVEKHERILTNLWLKCAVISKRGEGRCQNSFFPENGKQKGREEILIGEPKGG